MRKKPESDKGGDTKLLFKKSNNTICTQSRTCSGASQFYTRSAILQIKKNLSEATEQYVEGDKVKRDFSIETDICILRRYYKSKRLKMSNQGGSAKSKYSTVIDTELDEMDEFKPDTSACGDSKDTVTNQKAPKVDLATVMIDNLKGLLNNWIHKHLLDNKDNKEKIDTVLDSMLHRTDLNTPKEVNSQSTYILNREQKSYQVKNKKLETTSIMCQKCKHSYRPFIINASKTTLYKGLSSHSVPFSVKKIRLVSTLSIPRNIPKIRRINSLHIRKIGGKKIALTIDRSFDLLKSSSFDLLAISTKSLTKRCATFDLRYPYRKTSNFLYPEPTHKNTKLEVPKPSMIKNENQIINRDNLDDMPSLFKSIYADDPANITSNEKSVTRPMNVIHTMTSHSVNSNKIRKFSEENTKQLSLDNKLNSNIESISEKKPIESSISINFMKRPIEFSNLNANEYKRNYSTNFKINKRRNKSKRNKYDKRPQIHRIQNKHFSIDYNKMNNKQSEDKQLLRNFQNVLKYFSDCGNNKNIKFDININFLPLGDGLDKCTVVTSEVFRNNKHSTDIEPNPTVIYLEQKIDIPDEIEEILKENEENTEDIPEIMVIPSLEYSNQSKCLSNNDSISITTSKCSVENKKSIDSNDLELVKEISELKSVIKDLAVAAEKFVAERSKQDNNVIAGTENQSVLNNSSKGVQFSSNFQALVHCGIKLSKEPKKDANEYYNRLTKKSVSYNIIESESVLKVTDMTVINELNDQLKKEEGLTCSLPKSRSLFEMTNENKDKVATYYCEKCVPKPNFIYDCKTSAYAPRSIMKNLEVESKCSCKQSKSSCIYTDSCTPVKKESTKSKKSNDSSVSFKKSDNDCVMTPICRNKTGMGFGEGCLYCLLLWVPVIIILCLFYSFVLHEKLNPRPKLSRLRGDRKYMGCKENNTIDIKLSDLGF